MFTAACQMLGRNSSPLLSLPLAPLSATQVSDKGLTEVLTSPNIGTRRRGCGPNKARWYAWTMAPLLLMKWMSALALLFGRRVLSTFSGAVTIGGGAGHS